MEKMMVLATCVIALFTVALFILQAWQHQHDKKVAGANYKLALFDKRMETYRHIEQFIGEFLREGGPPIEAALKLRYETRSAHFLFPDQPLKFVEEIVEKSFKHSLAKSEWEPLRARAWGGEELSGEETKKKKAHLKDQHDIEDWFIQQLNEGRLKAEFDPYLALPETL